MRFSNGDRACEFGIDLAIGFLSLEILREPKTMVRANQGCWVPWQHPPNSWVALNVDGSSPGNTRPGGYGGLVQNDVGN